MIVNQYILGGLAYIILVTVLIFFWSGVHKMNDKFDGKNDG